MIKKIILQITFFFGIIILCQSLVAQNSILVNFGSASCSGSGIPAFSFIKDPLSDTSSPLLNCTLQDQLPNIYGVFVAYNPKDNKIYVADIRTFTETKIWVLDMGLPANISCPDLINTTPDYEYNYVSNNFEFDNNGDLWSFSNYNESTGQCNIDNLDITTGNIINARVLQFPAGNFPTAITSGDLTILPNGRMFATLGSSPSRLYEITNYRSSVANATAIFLDTLPQPCFGIAYLNGQLEITGTDFLGTCYYYKYDISKNSLDVAKNFQDGQLPIDNTSITPSLGLTKRLLNTEKINETTGILTYEIYARNLGNVALNNINIKDDLAFVYGAQNISDVTVSFEPGGNEAGLKLNPMFNGFTETMLLTEGQNLSNQTSLNKDYFVKLRLSLRVTNINLSKIYMNSAIGTATIGSVGTLSFINVSDSSNDGPQQAVDPNNNGNAGEPGENVPTPFIPGTLPVKFISINASINDETSALVKWTVATPTVQSDIFEIEFSTDGRNWKSIGKINIINSNQGSYQFLHSNIPSGNLFYRIKETDIDGAYLYSNITLLRNKKSLDNFVIFPNPATNFIKITSLADGTGKTQLTLYDAVGRKLSAATMTKNTQEVNTTSFPNGTYILKIENEGAITMQKIIVSHK